MLLGIKQIRRLADGQNFGTDVILGKGKTERVYKFRPLDAKKPEQDHVCDVTDKDDLATLLAIPSAHEVHDSELERGPAAGPAAKPAAAAGTGTAPQSSRVVSASAGEPWYLAEGVDRKKLLAAVAEKTGKKPHPSTATKKLQEALAS